MFNKINIVLCLILSFHFSCKKVEEGFNTIEKTVICTDATINLVSAFNDYMAFPDPDNCNTLKDVSSYYVSNEWDLPLPRFWLAFSLIWLMFPQNRWLFI